VWSWHIWVTNYDPEDESGHLTHNSGTQTRLEAPDAGKDHIFMDRNLGALSDAPGGDLRYAYGLFYQWGRKDPLPGNWGADADGSVPVIYTPDAPAGKPMPIVSPPLTVGIRYSIEHPGEFISMPSSLTGFWSWNDLAATSQANLWYSDTEVSDDVHKSVYDPCPAGWRMPARGVLEGYFPDTDAATTITEDGFLGTPYGYIPYAGYIDYTGTFVNGVGRYAFYTAQYDIPVWYSEWKDGKRWETTGGSQTSKFGSNAYSVRCIKDRVQ
jgi:hypothetical protein